MLSALEQPINLGADELKCVERSLTSDYASVSTTSFAVDFLPLITQGTAANQRIGRRILVTSVEIEGTLVGGQVASALDDSYNVIRILVGVSSSWATSMTGISLSTVLGPGRTAGLERMLCDKFVTLKSAGADSTGYLPAVQRVCIRVPVNQYFDIYATTALPTIGVCMVSDSGTVPNPGFTDGQMKISFTDQ